ncbi:hypothetical protein FHX74_001529 [Friedmanniella endophytica]|uniref:Glycoside hydrolase family 127 protein n=1 Tax=Microlunatus kandeliicorticis TaxID=1759536 RepID=A0A7W3IRH5_9ACTN|nr:beta-L-arabinofuranosidase domain-containing protein [Microlunatus kandeliicorticis]MBA8793924.1 hypothetical protein [Microlunatus kandeliicorticis]
MSRVAAGPLRPTPTAIGAARPVWFDLEGGFWGDWRRANSTTTLHHGVRWLTDLGYLENFRTAIAGRSEPYYGVHWMDSDLYKVVEAIGWDLAHTPDSELEAFLDEVSELVLALQAPDGYVNSHFQARARDRRWTDFAFGHEMYTGGHLVQAAVAVHRGTGDDRLLGAARRFADHLWDRFGPHGEPRIDGHPGIELALVELFRETGEQRHLELARLFVDRRGHSSLGPGHFGRLYVQDAVPIREATELTGHAVRAAYFAAGATDVAVETGDAELLDRTRLLWDDLVATKTYLTGGIGSRHFHEALGEAYELPPDRAYAESCAAIGLLMWSQRLALATGEARYADLAERVLHNGFAASTSLDRTHFWYQNPLLRRRPGPVPAEDRPVQERDELGTRAPWYDTACCPPNVMRTISSLGWSVATVTADDDTLRIDQLMPGQLRTTLAAGPVELEVRTRYPDQPTVTVRVLDAPADWTLELRLPSWSAAVRTGWWAAGERRAAEPDARGRLAASGLRAGQEVVLEPDLAVRLTAADRRVEAVAGQRAVERGPVVYALEGVDLPEGVDLLDVALAADPAPRVAVEDTLLGGTTAVVVRGTAAGAPRPVWPYGPASDPGTASSDSEDRPGPRPVELRLIPYARWANRGATTLRVWLPRSVPGDDGARPCRT